MSLRALSLALVIAAPAFAQDAPRVERVQFAKGASSKTITGSIRGYQAVNYVVGARAGQTLEASLKTTNGANYFNITADGADAALFVGSTNGNAAAIKLPEDGDYVVQVYLMRNAARRSEMAKYTLTIAVAP